MQVKEEAGNWRPATLFRSKQDRSVVLWFGRREYEGLSGDYRFSDMHLTDPDGVAIVYRRFAPVLIPSSDTAEASSTPGLQHTTRRISVAYCPFISVAIALQEATAITQGMRTQRACYKRIEVVGHW